MVLVNCRIVAPLALTVVVPACRSEAKRRRSAAPRRNSADGDSDHLRHRLTDIRRGERGRYSPRAEEPSTKITLPFFSQGQSDRLVAAHKAKETKDSGTTKKSDAAEL